MLRFFRKRRVWQVLLLGLTVIIGPYLYSRLVAQFRGAVIHRIQPTNVTEQASNQIAKTDPNLESDADDAKPKQVFRIAAYNIAHGRGQSVSNWTDESPGIRKKRLNKIAQLLRQIDADVVVLNEVDFDSSWSHHVDQASYLAKEAGYSHYATAHNLDFRVLGWTWRFGNAVLSKHPIKNARVINLPSFADWEERLAGKKRALRCEIQAPGGPYAVLAAHLSHRSESVRVQSSQVLLNEIARSKLPTVIAGDFNSAPSNFPMSSNDSLGINAIDTLDANDQLQRLPAALPDTSAFTYPSINPAQLIDWFFVPADCNIVDYQVTSSLLSDHRPIHATIQFPPSQH